MKFAQANPLTNSATGLKAAAEESNLIEHVDACNRVCRKGPVEEWGGAVRWHRHVGKACRPVIVRRNAGDTSFGFALRCRALSWTTFWGE
jgi:hypothetical protein